MAATVPRRGARTRATRDAPTEFAWLAAHVSACPAVYERYGRALREAAEANAIPALDDVDAELRRFDGARIPVATED